MRRQEAPHEQHPMHPRSRSVLNKPIEPVPAGIRLNLLIQPRASRSEIVGLQDGRIKVRLAAPPVDGAANEALLRFLADRLDVPRSRLDIASGANGRRKAIVVREIRLARLLLRCWVDARGKT
jgi:uncharacterized protein (TIGR00251 family)